MSRVILREEDISTYVSGGTANQTFAVARSDDSFDGLLHLIVGYIRLPAQFDGVINPDRGKTGGTRNDGGDSLEDHGVGLIGRLKRVIPVGPLGQDEGRLGWKGRSGYARCIYQQGLTKQSRDINRFDQPGRDIRANNLSFCGRSEHASGQTEIFWLTLVP